MLRIECADWECGQQIKLSINAIEVEPKRESVQTGQTGLLSVKSIELSCSGRRPLFRSTAETSLEVKWRKRNPFDKIRVGLNEAKESGSELIRLAQLN